MTAATPVDLTTIILAIISLIGTIFGGVMTYFMAKIQRQGAAAAVKAEVATEKVAEVKETLKTTSLVQNEKMDESLKIGKATHTLVNNNMQIALTVALDDKELAVQDKRKLLEFIELSGTPQAVEIAEKAVTLAIEARDKARVLLNEHIAKQKVVDAQYAKDAKDAD